MPAWALGTLRAHRPGHSHPIAPPYRTLSPPSSPCKMALLTPEITITIVAVSNLMINNYTLQSTYSIVTISTSINPKHGASYSSLETMVDSIVTVN